MPRTRGKRSAAAHWQQAANSLNPVARPHRTGVRLPAQLHAMGIVYTIDRAHVGVARIARCARRVWSWLSKGWGMRCRYRE